MVKHRADLLIWKKDLNLWTDSPIGLDFPFIYKAFQELCRCFSAQHDSIELIPSPNFGECFSNRHFVKTKRNPQDEWVPSRVRILFPTDTGGCFWNHRGSPIWSSYHVCFVHVGQQKNTRQENFSFTQKNQITCFNSQIATTCYNHSFGWDLLVQWYKKKIRNHHSNHCCHLSSHRCIPHGQRWGVSRLYNGWMHHVRCACVMKVARNEGKNSCNRSFLGSSPSWENRDLPNVGNFWRLLLPAFVMTLEGWDVAKRCSHQRLAGRFLWATLELQPSPRLCSSEKLWLQYSSRNGEWTHMPLNRRFRRLLYNTTQLPLGWRERHCSPKNVELRYLWTKNNINTVSPSTRIQA